MRVIAFFAAAYGRNESSVSEIILTSGLSAALRKRVRELSKGTAGA